MTTRTTLLAQLSHCPKAPGDGEPEVVVPVALFDQIAAELARDDVAQVVAWLPIESAPKDGRYIVALYRSLGGYAAHLHGRGFVVRHEGKTESGYDMGWALFPGFGGVPDKCLSHWQPLPAPPERGDFKETGS